jgi:hypothetical protein
VRSLHPRRGGGGFGLVAEARDLERVREEDGLAAAQRLEVAPLVRVGVRVRVRVR